MEKCEPRAGRTPERGRCGGTFFCPGSPHRYNLNRRAPRENRARTSKERSPMVTSRARTSPGPFVLAVVCLVTSAAGAFAQEATDAMAVTVQNPISSDAFKRVQNQINARLHSDNASR